MRTRGGVLVTPAERGEVGRCLRAVLARCGWRRAALAAVVWAGVWASVPAAPALATPHVFWANGNAGTIGELNSNGSGVNQSFITDGPGVGGVAVYGRRVYWTNGISGTIGVANLDGTDVNPGLITGAVKPLGVAVIGQHIYWTNFVPGTIGEANLDGSGVNQNFIMGADAQGLAVDGQHIYWASGLGAIGEANLDGTAVNPNFIKLDVAPFYVAVDGRHIYWIDQNRNVGEANLDGSGVNESFINLAPVGIPAGIATDGQHIYWTDAFNFTIGSANVDGSGVDDNLVSGAHQPFGIAVARPMAQITPATPAAFPTTQQGALSAPLSLTVSNAGNQDLSLSGVSFSGPASTDFVVGSDGCVGPLSPSSSCQLTVDFAPRAPGVRSATIQIASDDPAGPITVNLSGTGGPLPQGPPGPPGAVGPQGPSGPSRPQGPAGAAARIVCRNNPAAITLCSIEFAPGIWSSQTRSEQATFRITRAGRTVAHGTLTLRQGQITRRQIRGLRRGHYTLIIAVGHGRHPAILLTRVFSVK